MNANKGDSVLKELVLLSENLFTAFYKMVQAIRIHRNNNQLVIQSAEYFIRSVNRFSRDESHLKIQIISGRFYLQQEKVLYRRETANLMNNALVYFEKRGIHGLSLSTAIQRKDLKEMLLFAQLMNQAESHKDPSNWLEAQMSEKGLDWVEILPEPDPDDLHNLDQTDSLTITMDAMAADQENKAVKTAERTYAGSLASLKEVIGKVSDNRPTGIRKTIRVVQKTVDLVIDKRSILLKLSTLRDHDDYTYTHSVNVSILAICLGQHIGLTKSTLETLGICGLFHDLGKVDVPLEILNKQGKLTDHEFKVIQKHSLNSVRHIAKIRAPRELKSKIMLAPFEHHLKYDLSGYPRSWRSEPVSLFGRILTIVDVFDAITSARVYRSKAISPDEALRRMSESAGKDFDPILLKAFINMLGVYPVGTLVELNTGEIGLVSENPEQSDGAHPLVTILIPKDGQGYTRGETVDLSERETSGDSYKRSVSKTFNPALFGIQPSEFIL
ncbi:MAG: HD-GYP domain-containing protein [Planctomycetota bacterium]|jgi:HD-GYP domain-containing protein (c-di-GMP phosphodiesterase class II)